MKSHRTVKIALRVAAGVLSSKEKLSAYLSDKENFNARILFTLRDFLAQYSRKFDDVIFSYTHEVIGKLPNGTYTGVIGQINRSEVDIGVREITMNDRSTEAVGFTYPYKLSSTTFMIQQPEYKPQVFGILQTFSLSLWITIISVLVALTVVYQFSLKTKPSLDEIFLHIFAVFFRQSSMVKPSSSAETLLVYSWVLGAMFLCLAYESVFLSFLAFPPTIPIRDLSDLVAAVTKGEYHCLISPKSGTYSQLLKLNRENVQALVKDILNNNIYSDDTFINFIYERKKLKLAFLMDADCIEFLNVGKKFVSNDRFLEIMAAMTIRKGFCCKKLIDTFVHRLTASGLYRKFENDRAFIFRIPLLLKLAETDNSVRKLTLTDVAPGFIFLLTGYFISFLVLAWEIFSDRKKKKESF